MTGRGYSRAAPADGIAGGDAGGDRVMHTRLFRADMTRNRQILLEVTGLITPAMGGDLADRAELVLAELLNNIAKHGVIPLPDQQDHAPSPGPVGAVIQLCLVLETGGIHCTLSDTGLAIPQACISASRCPDPDMLPENGFGWPLIRLLVDRLCYVRKGGRNILSFRIPH